MRISLWRHARERGGYAPQSNFGGRRRRQAWSGRSCTAGYAALTTVLIALGISLSVAGSFTFFALNEVRINRAYVKAVEARAAAESGVEDMTYRLVSGKQTSASETLAVGNAAATVTLTQNGSRRVIRGEGVRDVYHQSMEALLDVTVESVPFFYGVQADTGGVAMDNGAQVNGNLFSNGSVSGGRVTGSVIVATGLAAAPSVEWPAGCTSTCGDTDHPFATASGNRDIAQSFTAPASGVLNKVSVFLGKNGAPSADITLRITTDVSNHPNTSEISNGTATIARSSVGAAPSRIDVVFPTAPAVTSGTKYWIVLDYSRDSPTDYWNWRKDSTDGYAGHTGKSTGNWSSRGAVWTDVGGDLAFRLWIGSSNTKLSNITVDGTARAPMFENVTAGGSDCPNPSCIVASEPPEPLPISDGVIQNWKDDACPTHDAACQVNGNYSVTADTSLGPKEITGDLLLTANNKTLTVTGTLYVRGNISVDNGSTVRCAPAYGDASCVVLSDGWLHVKNNGAFSGSGAARSYILLLSASACDGVSTAPPCDTAHHRAAIDLHNNATGAVFYAGRGKINVHENVAASQLSAYAMNLENNATLTYESGLQNAFFTAGPSAGYDVRYWKKTE